MDPLEGKNISELRSMRSARQLMKDHGIVEQLITAYVVINHAQMYEFVPKNWEEHIYVNRETPVCVFAIGEGSWVKVPMPQSTWKTILRLVGR